MGYQFDLTGNLPLPVHLDNPARAALHDHDTDIWKRLAGMNLNFLGCLVFLDHLLVRSGLRRAIHVTGLNIPARKLPTVLGILAVVFPFDLTFQADLADPATVVVRA